MRRERRDVWRQYFCGAFAGLLATREYDNKTSIEIAKGLADRLLEMEIEEDDRTEGRPPPPLGTG